MSVYITVSFVCRSTNPLIFSLSVFQEKEYPVKLARVEQLREDVEILIEDNKVRKKWN